MDNTRVLLALLGVALALAPLAADSAARIAAAVVPATTAVLIDGELTEEVWSRAPVATGFKQRDPRDGAPATFDTEVRVAYDDNAIYVAVSAADPDPAKLVGLRTRRDEGHPPTGSASPSILSTTAGLRMSSRSIPRA